MKNITDFRKTVNPVWSVPGNQQSSQATAVDSKICPSLHAVAKIAKNILERSQFLLTTLVRGGRRVPIKNCDFCNFCDFSKKLEKSQFL